MPTIKTTTLIALVICLSSCKNPNSYPRLSDKEQLSPVLSEPISIDGELYIKVKDSYCLSRVHRITKGYIGSVGRVITLDIYECNKVIGYAPDEYGSFITWMVNFRQWLLGFLR